MARHNARTLSAAEKGKATKARKALAGREGQTVTLNYTKRDGSEAVLTGQVLGFVGEGDKEAVSLVIRDKGYRSANLWNIKSVLP